jgi:hypothetical protein
MLHYRCFALSTGSEYLMDQIFQRIVDNNFSELKGSIVDASIPVPQALINEFIEAALREEKTIKSCRVSVHAENRVIVNLKTTLLPWPLNLKLKLDRSVDFASYSSPKVRAWMENNRLLGSLGAMFNVLPDGIRIYGDQVVLDLGAFLRTPEQKQILNLIKSVEVKTEEGKVILGARIRID